MIVDVAAAGDFVSKLKNVIKKVTMTSVCGVNFNWVNITTRGKRHLLESQALLYSLMPAHASLTQTGLPESS